MGDGQTDASSKMGVLSAIKSGRMGVGQPTLRVCYKWLLWFVSSVPSSPGELTEFLRSINQEDLTCFVLFCFSVLITWSSFFVTQRLSLLAMTRKLINTKAPAADEVLWEDKKKCMPSQ